MGSPQFSQRSILKLANALFRYAQNPPDLDERMPRTTSQAVPELQDLLFSEIEGLDQVPDVLVQILCFVDFVIGGMKRSTIGRFRRIRCSRRAKVGRVAASRRSIVCEAAELDLSSRGAHPCSRSATATWARASC